MEISVQNRKDAVAIVLSGSLDIYTSLDLKTKIEESLDPAKKLLVIDLTKVDYVDSSGIGTLIKGLNITKEKNITFMIVGVQPSIEKVFRVAGLLNFFNIMDSDEYNKKHPLIS